VVHADASVGPGRAKVEAHPPSEPVCPAGEVLLLPAEEAVVPPAALEPLRPASGAAAACGGGCGVVGSLNLDTQQVLLALMQCRWRHPLNLLRLALVVRLFVKEALSVGHPEPLHFVLVVLRDAHVEPPVLTQRSAREAGWGAGTSATCRCWG
jgi:hypothetical protein